MPSASRNTDSEPVYSRFRFGALGTQWEIATGEPLDDRLRRLILKRIDDFERTYSRFRDDSLVAHIAAAGGGGRFLFPEDSSVLFDLYDRLYEATGGAVDPLVGGSLELLGYDATYSLAPAPAAVREAESLARPKWPSDVIRDDTALITHAPLVIDVGAAGRAIWSTSSRSCCGQPELPITSSMAAAICAIPGPRPFASGSSTRSTPRWSSA
jgi:FAD:protein FMN transferase